MSTISIDSVWVKSEKNEKICFLGLVQVYTDKAGTTLKAYTTVSCSVHGTLLSFRKEFCFCLVKPGHSLAELLPLSIASQKGYENGSEDKNEDTAKIVPLWDKLPSTNFRKGREVKLLGLHEAMEIIFFTLKSCQRNEFELKFKCKLWV